MSTASMSKNVQNQTDWASETALSPHLAATLGPIVSTVCFLSLFSSRSQPLALDSLTSLNHIQADNLRLTIRSQVSPEDDGESRELWISER